MIDPEFDNYGACMRSALIHIYFVAMANILKKQSVSEDLLCAFELLKPLDGAALRKEMTKAKRKRCIS
jgi:serine/threonine-protein phosphatase PP1 catalytic subunit